MKPLLTLLQLEQTMLFVFNEIVPKEEEHKHELCIMDLVTTTEEARTTIIHNFKERYPNWESQKKWMIRSDEAKEFKNKHLNLLNKI